MAKKKSKKESEEPKNSIETTEDILKLSKQLPDDAQKKLKELKTKLDKFKKAALKKFENYVIGIALMPPKQAQDLIFNKNKGMPAPMPGGPAPAPAPGAVPPASLSPAATQPMPTSAIANSPTMTASLQKPAALTKEDKKQVEIFVLIDDADSKKMAKQELKDKLSTILSKMAKDIDENMNVDVWIISELWQNLYDAKYEILQLISISAPVYDKGMLAAIKIAEIHKTMVLKKFEKYIVSYVLAGSLVQGRATEKSDVDVFIVIDDTDVKRMTRYELKEKLRAIIIGMGLDAGDMTGIKNKLNVQVYILTDFWESMKEANPIIFTFLRDGVPFYDRGIFMPWKQLLKMGRIKPSAEAIDLYMNSGDQVLQRAKLKLKEIGMEDTFWAILTPSQAALMLYGVAPPTPKETPEIMRDLFVKKEKILEEEYIKILERNIKVRKDLEHGDLKEISGKEIDELLKDSEKYLKRIDKLFKQIQKTKEQESIVDMHDSIINMVKDVLKSEGVEKVLDSQITSLVDKNLVEKGKMTAKNLRTLKDVMKAKNDYDSGKLSKAEMAKVTKEAQTLMRILLEQIQRSKGMGLERSRLRVKYGKTHGEVFALGDEAFIIMESSKPNKVSKVKIHADGTLTSPVKSSQKELEHAIANLKLTQKSYMKAEFFEELKKLFGEDVEVSVGF